MVQVRQGEEQYPQSRDECGGQRIQHKPAPACQRQILRGTKTRIQRLPGGMAADAVQKSSGHRTTRDRVHAGKTAKQQS